MRRRVKDLIFIVLTLIVATPSLACSVCSYGEPGDKANTALRLSVLTLLVILCGVLALVIRFLVIFNKRLKMIDRNTI